jgi:hypothetical protein
VAINELILEIEPKVHHLGDDSYSGSANSQFQKNAEGTEFVQSFVIGNAHYNNYAKATLSFKAKGIQYNDNKLFINDKSYVLEESPSDGSYGNYSIDINKTEYQEGDNEIKLESGYGGDYDDFEFSNIVLTFSSPITNNDHLITLQRDGWNLVSICETISKEEIDMTGIQEIQSQNGLTIYTGAFAPYSNLNQLEEGYGYWLKSTKGTMFDVGQAQFSLKIPLKRTGWNLMGVCEDRAKTDINMSFYKEIQSQNGGTIYTGAFESFSNLDTLINGYGYWVKGDNEIEWIAKDGVHVPTGFEYQTINNTGETIETSVNDYSIKLWVNYEQSVDEQSNHTAIQVKVNGVKTPLMQIQSTYISKEMVVAVYDTEGILVGVSPIVTISNNMIVEVAVP